MTRRGDSEVVRRCRLRLLERRGVSHAEVSARRVERCERPSWAMQASGYGREASGSTPRAARTARRGPGASPECGEIRRRRSGNACGRAVRGRRRAVSSPRRCSSVAEGLKSLSRALSGVCRRKSTFVAVEQSPHLRVYRWRKSARCAMTSRASSSAPKMKLDLRRRRSGKPSA